jgi:hypothetical protein
MKLDPKIMKQLPGLRSGEYRVASPFDRRYNCIAWAAGDTQYWWDPARVFRSAPLGGYYWPRGIALETTLASFRHAFERLGYRACDSSELEAGWERVAIFADESGTPKHAARQAEDGKWISKLGKGPDIEHDTLDSVAGTSYGQVALILRRKRRDRPHPVEPW